jgi:hypothetical protein
MTSSWNSLACITLLAILGCPPPGPPAPVPPDADAAPAPVVDAAPAPAQDASPDPTCQGACDRLSTLCGPQRADCAAVLRTVTDRAIIREPCGKTLCPALTCADIAKASTISAVQALGVKCL